MSQARGCQYYLPSNMRHGEFRIGIGIARIEVDGLLISLGSKVMRSCLIQGISILIELNVSGIGGRATGVGEEERSDFRRVRAEGRGW